MRISATTLESFRLFNHPNNEWMTEDELLATIRGELKGNHNVNLGTAFGRVLEHPERYRERGGYRVVVSGWDSEEVFEFGDDVMAQPLALIDRRGVFEAKAVKAYGPHDVASKADHLVGAELSEFKTTLSTFDFDKYAHSCQWRFMADAFEPKKITYHVFCLDEATNGVIGLKGIESFNLYPYQHLHADCERLVAEFADYVTARGLADVLDRRQQEVA
jgi:hypothetical protein